MKHCIRVSGALNLVLSQRKSGAYGDLMSLDDHLRLQLDVRRGGKNRETISVNFREGLVIDYITAEQDAYWWVTAEHIGLVVSKESCCGELS